MNKLSPEALKQRSFILSAFTRLKMSISTSIYEFADYKIKTGWAPSLNDLTKVDQEILEEYMKFIKNK
jgi:hypothetical protein